MVPAKPKKAAPAVQTSFGNVDRKVLEELRKSFDTNVLLSAVDAVDQVRKCDDIIRSGILALHGMAINVINDDYSAGTFRRRTVRDPKGWHRGGNACRALDSLRRQAFQPDDRSSNLQPSIAAVQRAISSGSMPIRERLQIKARTRQFAACAGESRIWVTLS